MDKEQSNQSEHLPYDPAYKKFFSDPRMVESLLRDFVTEDFVRDLDFSSMELLPTEYVHDDLSRGFSDVVWKIKWKNGSACYVVLVLEFQRAQDYLMALRIVAYTAELLLKLCRSGAIKQGELLPPVLPVVVYNGNGKWRANREVSKMFVEMPDNLAAYRPQQKYYLVDINEFPREMLEKLRTLVPLLFRLEKADSRNDLLPALKIMAEIFKDKAGDALVQDFITWLKCILSKNYSGERPLPEVANLTEMYTMLYENAAHWGDADYNRGFLAGKAIAAEDARAEGEARGRVEGITIGEARGITIGEARGITIGEAAGLQFSIKNYLKIRFGVMPDKLTHQISGITDVEKLRNLLTSAYHINSLQEFIELMARKA